MRLKCGGGWKKSILKTGKNPKFRKKFVKVDTVLGMKNDYFQKKWGILLKKTTFFAFQGMTRASLINNFS